MDKQEDVIRKFSKYKGIVFDFDGTLVDLNCRWDDLKKKLSEYCAREKKQQISFTPLNCKLLEMRDKFGVIFFKKLIDIVYDFEKEESCYVLHYNLINYINRSNQKIAIYSMNNCSTIDKFCKKYLKNMPDTIIGRENCKELKPSRLDLELIIKKWGFPPELIAFIGDSEDDRLSGTYSGIQTFII